MEIEDRTFLCFDDKWTFLSIPFKKACHIKIYVNLMIQGQNYAVLQGGYQMNNLHNLILHNQLLTQDPYLQVFTEATSSIKPGWYHQLVLIPVSEDLWSKDMLLYIQTYYLQSSCLHTIPYVYKGIHNLIIIVINVIDFPCLFTTPS